MKKKTKMVLLLMVICLLGFCNVGRLCYYEYHAEHNDELIRLFLRMYDTQEGVLSCSDEEEWEKLTAEVEARCENLNPTNMGDCAAVKTLLLNLCSMEWDDAERQELVEVIGAMSFSWKQLKDGRYVTLKIENLPNILSKNF